MPPILVAIDGPVTTVTLNRPDKRNALDVDLLEQLCAALATAAADRTRRIVVLRGAGAAFCSGLDLAEAADPGRAAQSAELVAKALRMLAETPLVTIAAVHGAAIAGGAGLMSACDFVVATARAKIGYPEVRRGLVPALVMTFLRRRLGERDARELLLLGSLHEADRLPVRGLVNRIVPNEASLAIEVQRLVDALLQGGPRALADTKRLLGELWPVPVTSDLERAHAFHLSARNSPEAAEGIAAFQEKRLPRWPLR
jgi:methylglutaconyl-CoA hydratase